MISLTTCDVHSDLISSYWLSQRSILLISKLLFLVLHQCIYYFGIYKLNRNYLIHITFCVVYWQAWFSEFSGIIYQGVDIFLVPGSLNWTHHPEMVLPVLNRREGSLPWTCRLHIYELQHRIFMGFFDARAHCWIMDNLLSTKTPRSRYYKSHHFWNYGEHHISHFWQALIFQKTLLYIKYLKISSFSLQRKILPKGAEDQAFKPVFIFNVGKLSNSMYLNEQISRRI